MTNREQSELTCPSHNKRLVLREAKAGINRGTKFWGCPTWSRTACNYTVPYKTFQKIEPTIKEKFLDKIKNKKGKISPLKIIGMLFIIPIYILGFFVATTNEVFSEIRKKGL